MKKILLALAVLNIPLLNANNNLSIAKKVLQKFGIIKQEQIIVAPSSARIAFIYIPDQNDQQFSALHKNLFFVLKQDDIKGLVIQFDNRGGSYSNYTTIHDLIKQINKKKPVVGFVEAAVSCGYLIASACRYIITNSMPDLGGVGVLWRFDKYKNCQTSDNCKADLIPYAFIAGKYKSALADKYHELTESEKSYFQEAVNKSYQDALKLIAENRNLSLEASHEWADSRFFTADEAIALHLTDAKGTVLDVEQKMLEYVRAENPTINFSDKLEIIIL